MSLAIVIIDKMGGLKTLNVKNYCEEDLYKKCGFKKDTNFLLQTTWNVSLNDVNYSISMYGKTDGKKKFENTCTFPYPINDKIFFGSCALVASSGENKVNLTVDLWNQLHPIILNNQTESSFSFVNSSHESSKSQKKTSKSSEKEKDKEKQKRKNKDKEEKKEQKEEIITETNSALFQELEEEEYNYSSDEEI